MDQQIIKCVIGSQDFDKFRNCIMDTMASTKKAPANISSSKATPRADPKCAPACVKPDGSCAC